MGKPAIKAVQLTTKGLKFNDMKDFELLATIENLRSRIREFKGSEKCRNGGALTNFFVNVIEISTALVEIGLLRNRPILEAEHYWFQASYYLDFEFAGGEYKDILDNYEKMVQEVENRNFFAETPTTIT